MFKRHSRMNVSENYNSTLRKKLSSSLFASCIGSMLRWKLGGGLLTGWQKWQQGCRSGGKGAGFITVNALNELQTNRTCKRIQTLRLGLKCRQMQL